MRWTRRWRCRVVGQIDHLQRDAQALAQGVGIALAQDLALTQELALRLDQEGRPAIEISDQRSVDDEALRGFQLDSERHGAGSVLEDTGPSTPFVNDD